MATYSTKQVTEAAGIGRMTLLRWLRDGKIPEPRRVNAGGVEARVWTERDLARVKRVKKYQGRGRKKKTAAKAG